MNRLSVEQEIIVNKVNVSMKLLERLEQKINGIQQLLKLLNTRIISEAFETRQF